MVHNNKQNDTETATIVALASVSKTPFKTAFKATLGVAAAQAILSLIVIVSILSVIFIGTLILK